MGADDFALLRPWKNNVQHEQTLGSKHIFYCECVSYPFYGVLPIFGICKITSVLIRSRRLNSVFDRGGINVGVGCLLLLILITLLTGFKNSIRF